MDFTIHHHFELKVIEILDSNLMLKTKKRDMRENPLTDRPTVYCKMINVVSATLL